MGRGGADRVVIRRTGLDVHPPPLRTPPGPTRHLGHQLKRPLRRSEIGQMKSGVRVDHAHNRDIGKVESFGDHLRAEQDVEPALRHALEHAVMRPLGAGRVQVHARDTGRGEPQPHEVLELLRAEAAHALGLLAAHAARGGNLLLVAAIVAA